MQVRRLTVTIEPGADYTSAFELTPATGGDARAWATAVFASAPAGFRLVLRAGWRIGLRLALAGSGPLGWQLRGTSATAELAADGPLLSAVNRVDRTADTVVWTTVVTYRTVLGRVVWTLAAPVHHLTIPWLLRNAAGHLPGQRPARSARNWRVAAQQ